MSLKQAFRDRSLLQRDAAEHLGVSEATVSKWVNGHEAVPPDLMRPFAEWLGVSIEMIVPAGERRVANGPRAA
jgi:plasmid maintenance system antidote protein VapI